MTSTCCYYIAVRIAVVAWFCARVVRVKRDLERVGGGVAVGVRFERGLYHENRLYVNEVVFKKISVIAPVSSIVFCFRHILRAQHLDEPNWIIKINADGQIQMPSRILCNGT
jgi:hypothetical protein